MKTRTLEGFGPRLVALRQSRGLTQVELGKAAGISQRMIAYYELESAQPPGPLLVDLAKGLRVSADELLGLTPVRQLTQRKTARLLKRLQRIEELPPPISALSSSSSMPCSTPADAPVHPRAPNAKRAESAT